MSESPITNNLARSSSPYLRQHADNPVAWQPWGKETLDRARQENKLLLISIGYSACHWCHVMEHECFSDPQVAEVMNQHFINIKVDREERPDVDQVYMEALQLMTGQGGWPLNVIALPDQRPVFGGTYFPRENWLELLQKVASMFRTEPERFEEYAGKMMKALKTLDNTTELDAKKHVSPEQLEQVYGKLEEATDATEGGIGGAPKFPMPPVWQAMLYYYVLSGRKSILEKVHHTLVQMASGGIYDQIGGGFARYSTDEKWIVPHFEKMLYDNGQLMALYADAYRLTGTPLFRRVVDETFDFLERELSDPEGAFYAALDADSEGEEGRYYVWSREAFEKAAGEDAAWALKYFGVDAKGHWEDGKNILLRAWDEASIMEDTGMDEATFASRRDRVRNNLLEARKQRVAPARDDKILTGWNALMISGLVASYKATGDERFRERALKARTFIHKYLSKDDVLYRVCDPRGKNAYITAFLDDYALYIAALCDLYEITGDEALLTEAEAKTQYVNNHFWDDTQGLYFYTNADSDPLIIRKKDIPDNVIPASNSVMAANLFRLGHLLGDEAWSDRSREMVRRMKSSIMRSPVFHAGWARVMAMHGGPWFEIGVTGPESGKGALALEGHYLPCKVLAFASEPEQSRAVFLQDKAATAETTFYLCQNRTCRLPVTTPEEVLEQARSVITAWQTSE